MARVTLSTNDPFVTKIMDEKETSDMFGDDYIEDYGVEVSEILVEKFKKNWEEFWSIQKEIQIILKENK